MIISASRRTDIPAYYADWFFNRLREGFVLSQNPMNPCQIREIALSPEAVDCIVFWSKNPEPMLERLDALGAYPFYFQFTLNAYAQDIETRLPKKAVLIDTFRRLSEKIGAERVIWRYDPIFLSDRYTLAYHIENFGKIARLLGGCTEQVTISFIDFYSKIEGNMKAHNIRQLRPEEQHAAANEFARIAAEHHMKITACAEAADLSPYGVSHASCIDKQMITRIIGRALAVKKDNNQRTNCGCAASVDIGVYNSCANGCLYCYANYSPVSVEKNRKKHNVCSPLLIGESPDKKITKESMRATK